MGEEVSVWYDAEGDYLEVLFARTKGYFRETDHDAVMEKLVCLSYSSSVALSGQKLQTQTGFPSSARW